MYKRQEITVSPQGTTPVLFAAEELSGDGTSLVIADRTNAWSIEVNGAMTVSGTVFGAGITCNGTCILDQANMMSTGPIEVFGSISVTDSALNGGISDEDIIVWNDASVEWTNSTGTGGVTDNWVNILTTRTLGVQNGYVVFYGYDMGYDGVDTSALYDNSTFELENQGDNVIEIGQNERSRMCVGKMVMVLCMKKMLAVLLNCKHHGVFMSTKLTNYPRQNTLRLIWDCRY